MSVDWRASRYTVSVSYTPHSQFSFLPQVMLTILYTCQWYYFTIPGPSSSCLNMTLYEILIVFSLSKLGDA
jgi:hypothetical protein